MWKHTFRRLYSRLSLPAPVPVPIRVSNNIVRIDESSRSKEGPMPRQLLSLPPFPPLPLPGSSKTDSSSHVTAISWVKYYFHRGNNSIIQHLFNKGLKVLNLDEIQLFGVSPKLVAVNLWHQEEHLVQERILVQMECSNSGRSSIGKEIVARSLRKIKPNEVMETGAQVHLPVSVAESRISRRFDTIPSGTLNPNADEIAYLKRLVLYKAVDLYRADSAILVLNKPPKLPVKGNLPIHNSMDALAAAALSYDYDEGPKLVHRLDRESSGIILMGRTKESISHLQRLFSDANRSSCMAWDNACEASYQRYWALVIGCPKEKQGFIHAPLSKVLLDDGKTERVMLARKSSLEASQDAVTEYRVLGPTVNGCSWVELRPLTSRKHQLRVHCAEALGTPIVGDYKYGWFVHQKWRQMARIDTEPTTGKAYKLRRPEGLDVQKGSVLSKVPLLHLHSREIVLPDIAKFGAVLKEELGLDTRFSKSDMLRFVASMPSHMKISWNLMSSYLV